MDIKFKIITQERVVYDDEVSQATIPTQDGEITVLPRHAPIVSILKPGVVTIKKNGKSHHLSVSSGFVEVRHGSELVILADSAERAEDVDLERAQQARDRAQKMLDEKESLSATEYAMVVASLEKELARIKTSKKWKNS